MRPRLAYLLYRGGAAALRGLPDPLVRVVGALGGLVANVSPTKHAIVEDNLKQILGAVPSRVLNRAIRRSFISYGVYWAEAARLGRLMERERPLSFTIEGLEFIDRAVEEGKGLLLVLPHLGCWEAGGCFLARRGIELTTVAEVLEPPELFAWFIKERARLGLHVVPNSLRAVATLASTLRSGGSVALIADRDLSGDGVDVELFGASTRLPMGPAVLSLRTGAALVPCAVYHVGGGHHHAVVLPPIPHDRRGDLREDVNRVTVAIGQALEALIGRAPDQWHVLQPYWRPARGEDSADNRPLDELLAEPGGTKGQSARHRSRAAFRSRATTLPRRTG